MTEKFTERELQIEKLQQNLSSIRKIAGWTSETLGDKIGVTKQTISNLENNKTPLNFTQYIAIRAVFDYEINKNENEILSKVVTILLDSSDEIDEENYSKVQDVVDTVAATAVGGIPTAKLDEIFDILIMSIPVVASIIAVMIANPKMWANKLFK